MHKARVLAEEAGSCPQVSEPPALNLGCSGWFYWHLEGSFYPTQMPTKDWFAYYAEHFDTVELNAPFYSRGCATGVDTREPIRQQLRRLMAVVIDPDARETHGLPTT